MAEKKKIITEEVPKKIGYRDILKNKEFAKLLIAKIISRFGDSIDIVAYGWMVFQLTGSATLLAVLYAVSGVPSFLFNMISGVVVTYLPKKKVVYLCDFGRGLTVLVTAILYLSGNLAVWHLFIFAFLNSTFEAFRDPAATPLFVKIISKNKNKEIYDYAIAASSTGGTFAELIGYSVAGLLIGTIGVGAVIALDAATFILSGLLIILVKVEKEELSKTKLTMKQYFIDFKSGYSYIFNSKLIKSICIFAGLFNLLIIPFSALQPAYISEVLNKGPEALSVIAVAFLLAMTVGGFLAPMLKEKLSGRIMFISSGILISLGYFILSQLGILSESALVYVYLAGAAGIMGIALPILNLPIQVGIMSKVEEEYLPRTVSFINSLALSTTPIGGGIVGGLILFIALKEIYLIFSIGILILFILQIFNSSLKEL